MSKKRGLSLDDKREKMLEIFYETQDFFQLKELEKKGPSKGVISQSVKDVVQSLIDDDLLRHTKAKLESERAAIAIRHEELEKRLETLKKERTDSADREAKLSLLKSLEDANKNMMKELEHYADNDPEVLDKKRKAANVAHDAINRWTDNIFALQQWCNKTYPEAKDELVGMYKEFKEMSEM